MCFNQFKNKLQLWRESTPLLFLKEFVWTGLGIFLPYFACVIFLTISGFNINQYIKEEIVSAGISFSAASLLFVELIDVSRQKEKMKYWGTGVVILGVSLLGSCALINNQYLGEMNVVQKNDSFLIFVNFTITVLIMTYLAATSVASANVVSPCGNDTSVVL